MSVINTWILLMYLPSRNFIKETLSILNRKTTPFCLHEFCVFMPLKIQRSGKHLLDVWYCVWIRRARCVERSYFEVNVVWCINCADICFFCSTLLMVEPLPQPYKCTWYSDIQNLKHFTSSINWSFHGSWSHRLTSRLSVIIYETAWKSH